MNKKHWNTIVVDGTVSNSLLKEWITDSYDLIVASLPAKARELVKGKK
jgi:predicted DNA-binding protein (MmcQ/YjbR family)